MKKISKVRKEAKRALKAELTAEKIAKIAEELKTYYINYDDVRKSIEDEDHFELLEEYKNELNIENEDIFNYWNDFEEFFEANFANDLEGLANAVCYGDYRGTDDKITFDGYGNIKSVSEWDFEAEVEELFEEHKEEIIKKAIEDERTFEATQWQEMKQKRLELMKPYLKDRERKQKEVDEMPFGFAFSNEQFEEMMKKWGLNPEKDLNKIVSIGNGGFIKKEDYKKTAQRMRKQEKLEALKMTNERYFTGAILEEMANHELFYNYDILFDLQNCFGWSDEKMEKLKDYIIKFIKPFEYEIEASWSY